MKGKSYRLAASVQIFFMYSIVGWIYETVLEVMIYRTGFSNRGFLFGPYLPVYGVGALLFLVMLYPIEKEKKFGKLTPLSIFVGSMIIATLVELLTSYGLSHFGVELWNYDNYSFNFQGRIALNPSVRFGIGGVIFLYGLQPLFDKLIEKQSEKTIKSIALIIAFVLLTDFIFKMI